FRTTIASRDGDQAVQERVPRVRRLEARHRPEVVPGRVHCLTAAEGCDDFWWPVAQAKRFHRDERAIVGLESRPKVQLQYAIRPKGWRSTTRAFRGPSEGCRRSG